MAATDRPPAAARDTTAGVGRRRCPNGPRQRRAPNCAASAAEFSAPSGLAAWRRLTRTRTVPERWSLVHVMDRMEEAFRMLSRLPLPTRPSGYINSMPIYLYDQGDLNSQLETYELERMAKIRNRVRMPPSPAEIARMDEKSKTAKKPPRRQHHRAARAGGEARPARRRGGDDQAHCGIARTVAVEIGDVGLHRAGRGDGARLDRRSGRQVVPVLGAVALSVK